MKHRVTVNRPVMAAPGERAARANNSQADLVPPSRDSGYAEPPPGGTRRNRLALDHIHHNHYRSPFLGRCKFGFIRFVISQSRLAWSHLYLCLIIGLLIALPISIVLKSSVRA